MNDRFDHAIIGGGIAGLASAYEILRARPDASLLVNEAEDRLGGKIRTTHEDGFAVPMAFHLVPHVGFG